MKKPIIISCAILCVFICFVVYILHQPRVHLIPTNEDFMTWEIPLEFQSFGEVQDYVYLIYNDPSKTKYKQYTYMDYEIAEKVAANISSTMLPCVKEGAPIHCFAATYVINNNSNIHTLRISWFVDGVQYRFSTSFDDSSRTVDGRKWIKDQMIDSVTFDLYKGDENLIGAFELGDISFGVGVLTNRVGDVNFEHFEFVSIPRFSEKE